MYRRERDIYREIERGKYGSCMEVMTRMRSWLQGGKSCVYLVGGFVSKIWKDSGLFIPKRTSRLSNFISHHMNNIDFFLKREQY